MNRFLLIVTMLLCAIHTNAQEVEENPAADRENAQKWKVKIIKEMTDSQFLHRIYRYDNNGNLVSDVQYNKQKPKDSVYFLYTYNAQNQLVKKRHSKYMNLEGDIIDSAHTLYDYDTKGRLAKRTLVNQGKDTTTYIYNYSIKTNKLETMRADSIEIRRYRFMYDNAGLLTQKIVETPIARSTEWMEFGSYSYAYNEKKQMIKETYISEETEKKRSEITYNPSGKVSGKTVYVYADTKPVYNVRYYYDPKNLLPAGRTLTWMPDKNQTKYTISKFTYLYTYAK